MRSARSTSGSCAARPASLLMVKAAGGSDPVRSMKRSAPTRAMSGSKSGAVVVSFHSLAGRSGTPSPSSATRPWHCPPTEMAATRESAGAPAIAARKAATNARHQSSGSCSLSGGVTTG